MADFEKVGLLTMKGNRLLLCRKDHATSKLILPGGRIERGESALDCLTRELKEELGAISVTGLTYIGAYEDIAYLEDPSIKKTLRIQLYGGDLVGKPVPSNEIVELIWFGAESDRSALTPIFTKKILPDLMARGFLKSGLIFRIRPGSALFLTALKRQFGHNGLLPRLASASLPHRLQYMGTLLSDMVPSPNRDSTEL